MQSYAGFHRADILNATSRVLHTSNPANDDVPNPLSSIPCPHYDLLFKEWELYLNFGDDLVAGDSMAFGCSFRSRV